MVMKGNTLRSSGKSLDSAGLTPRKLRRSTQLLTELLVSPALPIPPAVPRESITPPLLPDSRPDHDAAVIERTASSMTAPAVRAPDSRRASSSEPVDDQASDGEIAVPPIGDRSVRTTSTYDAGIVSTFLQVLIRQPPPRLATSKVRNCLFFELKHPVFTPDSVRSCLPLF